MVFLSRHLVERMDEAKCGWWGQELPQRFGMSDRMVRTSGRRALQTCSWRLWSLEGMWKAAREIQIHSPGNWLFSCISERHSLVGLIAIVSFCCLWGVEAKEMWGKDAAFRGLEVRSPPAHGAYCSDICKPPFLIQSEMGHAVKQNLIKRKRCSHWWMGGEEGKVRADTMDKWNFCGLSDLSIPCGVDNMKPP